MRKAIRKIDITAKSPTFTINENSRLRTTFGGILSLLGIIIIIGFVIFQIFTTFN
jgi:hypothetical protein